MSREREGYGFRARDFVAPRNDVYDCAGLVNKESPMRPMRQRKVG